MEVAEKLFAQKGFEGTSVRDIAEAADVNLAMISYYFGSKEKLMESLFLLRSHVSTLQIQTVLNNKELSLWEKVDKLIEDLVDRIFQNQSFHKIMVREQMVHPGGAIGEQIFQLKQRNLALIKQLIHEGQKKGEFAKHIDIPLMMMTLVGTCNQFIGAHHYYKKVHNLESLSDAEYQKQTRKKILNHLKTLFKAILVYEE